VFYRLRMPCMLSFFSCVTSVMKSRAEAQMELLG